MESDVTSCSGGEEEGVSAEAPPPGQGRYAALGPGGGPLPLAPELVTLSMLPRSQWQGLIHLDVIKVRPRALLRMMSICARAARAAAALLVDNRMRRVVH